MYNPEAVLWPEGYFTIIPDEEFPETSDQIVSVSFEEDEGEYILAVEPDLLFDQPEYEAESIVEDAVFDDLPGFENLVEEINLETAGMTDAEVEAYMQDRIEEFWPALLAALPAVIQLAPQVINAVSSLVSKPSKPKPAQQPKQASAPAKTNAPVRTITPPPVQVSQIAKPVVATNPTADPQQLLSVFNSLVNSPVVQQLLSNLASGSGQSAVSVQGSQVSANNVLNVLSGLAGALAGTGEQVSRETAFPEYIRNTEGRYLIDPFDVYQEAELILDLLNT